jgi:hypothetical protein
VPKISWRNLPPALRDHLFERLRQRRITAEDVYRLKLWRELEPEAPEGCQCGSLRRFVGRGPFDRADVGGEQIHCVGVAQTMRTLERDVQAASPRPDLEGFGDGRRPEQTFRAGP